MAQKLYRAIASRATDRPTENVNTAAAVSTEDTIENRANTPPGPSLSPGGVFAGIRDFWFPVASEAGKSDT